MRQEAGQRRGGGGGGRRARQALAVAAGRRTGCVCQGRRHAVRVGHPLLDHRAGLYAVVRQRPAGQRLLLEEQVLLDRVHAGVLVDLALERVDCVVLEDPNFGLRRGHGEQYVRTTAGRGCVMWPCVAEPARTTTPSSRLNPTSKPAVPWTGRPIAFGTEWPRSIEPVSELTAVLLLFAW